MLSLISFIKTHRLNIFKHIKTFGKRKQISTIKTPLCVCVTGGCCSADRWCPAFRGELIKGFNLMLNKSTHRGSDLTSIGSSRLSPSTP